MFVRNSMDKRRVIIIDYSHLAHIYMNGKVPQLYSSIKVNNDVVNINTTIPAYTIKTINRWARNGNNPVAVCFDGKDSSRSRKAYFAQLYGEVDGYKAKRDVKSPVLYEGINLTLNRLMKAEVPCFKMDGYEADDLVKACVDRAKIDYPDLPIDVITGDCDLLPLVDEQVSVFLRDRKTTYAEEKEIEKRSYVQVTPRNFQKYLEDRPAFKGLHVPYNTVLLSKLLRGDKSDNIKAKKGWTPTQYNMLVDYLVENTDLDLSEVFRYSTPTTKRVYKGTTTEIPVELLSTVKREEIGYICSEPPALEGILDIFRIYCEESDVEHVRQIYNGLNLNGAFLDVPEGFQRIPATLLMGKKNVVVAGHNEVKEVLPIREYSSLKLQSELSDLRINITL